MCYYVYIIVKEDILKDLKIYENVTMSSEALNHYYYDKS